MYASKASLAGQKIMLEDKVERRRKTLGNNLEFFELVLFLGRTVCTKTLMNIAQGDRSGTL